MKLNKLFHAFKQKMIWENILKSLLLAATRGIRIDAVYFDTTQLSTAEIQISTFTSPDGAYVGDTMTFTADIQSNTDAEVMLSLYDNNELVVTLLLLTSLPTMDILSMLPGLMDLVLSLVLPAI